MRSREIECYRAKRVRAWLKGNSRLRRRRANGAAKSYKSESKRDRRCVMASEGNWEVETEKEEQKKKNNTRDRSRFE